MSDKPPDRVERCEAYVAEYRRLRDSRGEEQILVTMRNDAVTKDDTIHERKFMIDMDALERFASYEVPKDGYAKPYDSEKPDRVERFKQYTASFHAGTRDGHEVAFVRLHSAKERPDGVWAVQDNFWLQHGVAKEFAAGGLEYEKELGHTKRWHVLVRVIGLGGSEGTGLVQTLASIEDKERARERAQRHADTSAQDVLWPHLFRSRIEAGERFTVRGDTEGGYGYGRIGIGIERQLWKRDRDGEAHVVGLWHEMSCEPYERMAVRFNSAYEPHTGRPREMLVFPEGARREPGPPKKVEYLLIETSRPGHGMVKKLFGKDVERAVAELHTLEQLHRERMVPDPLGLEMSRREMPRGFRP